ncbi:lipoprotein [Mesoplasma melaleucae]|uniref:Lipoprotein n=1 Tax=Mesoplasma melaleucae TaxID=81459 RepID=A0A2K8NYN2_9MOLU|nr:lipoprotein [Mesoplasma melaleucae]ATZ17851.1 hypothetical protein EMELA_v1c02780 [Mesoplasma melaleucae]
MKKILAILAAVGLTATTSSLVVSCSKPVDRFNKLNFKDKAVYETFIIKMKDQGLISVSEAEKFLRISDTEIIADVLKILDKRISEEEYKATNASLASTLKLKEKSSDENITSNLLDSLATNKFYSEYTSKIITNNGIVNDWDYMNEHSLNAFNLFEDDAKVNYSIYYKADGSDTLTRWQARNEFNQTIRNTPTLEILNSNTNNFFLVGAFNDTAVTALPTTTKIINKDTSIGGISAPFLIKKSETVEGFNGNEIMKYRFQSYINAKIIPDLYTQLISLAYLDSNLYSTNYTSKNYTNAFARLNTSNKLVSSFQNSLISDTKTSNVKLIWSFKSDVSTDTTEWVKAYKKALGIPDASGNIILNSGNIATLIEKFKEGSVDKLENVTKLGTDPFLGLIGYNGIVKNSESGIEAISGSLSISTDAQTAAKAINAPTILTGANDQGFSVGDAGEHEIVLVLPLYLNDIFDSSNVTLLSSNGQAEFTIPENTWIPLGDKYSPYIDNVNAYKDETGLDVIKDKTRNIYIKAQSDAGGSITLGDTSTLKVTVKVEKETSTMLGIHEVINKEDSTFKNAFSADDQAKVKDTDKILHSVLLSRNADPKGVYELTQRWEMSSQTSQDVKNLSSTKKELLLSEIENGLVTGDTDYTTEAKEELYTKYIMDGDNVLYQALYDEISKYIKEDDSGSSD